MYLGDFQICLRVHEHEMYLRLRRVWDPLELQIRKDIPRKLNFGGVKKIVLELGAESEARPKYRVLLDVGLYHVEDFDPDRFLLLAPEQQRAQIARVVRVAMTELGERFHTSIEWVTDSIARSEFHEGA